MKFSIKNQFKFATLFVVLVSCFDFAACSDNKDSSDEPGIYEGKTFVGSWQGSDGDDTFFVTLSADGTYTDYLVVGGQKESKASGKYTVTGDKLSVPSNSNFANAWGQSVITMTFSGENKMSWTNSLMNSWGVSLTFNRK